MEQLIFRVGAQKHTVTREIVLSAMREYDAHHRVTLNDSGRKYAVKHDRKFYPPKHILSLAIRKPRTSFSGGKGKNAANPVFLKLGFDIVHVGNDQDTISSKSAHSKAKINAPVPTMQALIESLLYQKWTNLHANYSNLEDGDYPGVYGLAYSDENLEGKPVKEEEIFYVGMSHAGIRQRLAQFIKGIEDGEHHSGASRFYKDYASRVPYSRLPNRMTFFVASVAIPCVVNKNERMPKDLRKMGEVARLEFYVLAHIKEKLHTEPELNKK